MLDLGFFADRRFSVSTGAITLVMFAMFGSLFILTQLLQLALGYSAFEAGVRMLPVAVTMFVVAPASAKLVERLGTKLVVGTGMAVVSLGLVLTSRIEVADGYGSIATAMVVLALGMALVMAPATEAIMGSLPAAKAGVGSAVNDTTREVGGALGVAVLGSVLSSTYGSRVAGALEGSPLPVEVRSVVEESLGGALAVAGRLGGDAGATVAAVARDAFVDGMGVALVIGAVVALAGSIGVFAFLPSRARSEDLVPEPAPAPELEPELETASSAA
jgi:hypothetical protein